MKMPSHVLRLMCHWLCYYSWLHQAAHKLNACKHWSINPLLIGPYTVSARAHVHKSVWEKHRQEKKKNINLLSIVVFHLTWKVSREARFWLTSGQTASIQGHWQTKSSWIAFSIARALYAPPDEIWDESLYVNTRVLRNQTWGDNTPTHLPHATRKMQTAQCSMYCFLACCSLLHRGRGAG